MSAAIPSALLPSPDFSHPVVRHVTGLRPYRKNGYRLEATTLLNKKVIHNYGHGGAGITMSWGCAEEVKQLVLNGNVPNTSAIAVLGAGVMGLTAATLLRKAGYRVTIYAEKIHPCTTSDKAGGQWSPSIIEVRPGATAEFERILTTAFHTFTAQIGNEFGVVKRRNYTLELSPSFGRVPRTLIPEPTKLPHLPFQLLNRSGYCYHTLLIEVPVFMERLHRDLLNGGVKIIPGKIASQAAVTALPEQVIVNCTGLGSRAIWPDRHLESRQGHLAILAPQSNLEYLFSGNGYLFPRTDGVIIGGTNYRPNDYHGAGSEDPDPGRGQMLFENMRRTFAGHPMARSELPDYLITDI